MIKNLVLVLSVLLTAFSGFADEREDAAPVQEKFPLGADIYLTNNVGAGTFFKPYQQQPYVASSLYLYPHYLSGPILGEREIKVQAELSGNLEWMSTDNPFPGKFKDKWSLGDMKVRAEFKKALYAKDWGLSLSPAFKLEAPFSSGSWSSNRVIGLGGYFTANFSMGGFFLTYKPVVLGYAYSAPYKTGDCSDENIADDRLSNGKCKAAGRQTMALWKNGFFTGYTNGTHTVTLGFRTYHSFLRGANKGEKPEKEASSGIMEATLGLLEYAYNLPVSVPTTILLGVSSYQAPYDANKAFRFPFFSFADPAKNQTEAYVAVNVTI